MTHQITKKCQKDSFCRNIPITKSKKKIINTKIIIIIINYFGQVGGSSHPFFFNFFKPFLWIFLIFLWFLNCFNFYYFLIEYIYNTWQGYYRNISTKLVFLALFGRLRGHISTLGSSGATLKTACSFGSFFYSFPFLLTN
jgi:hypothetical protein